ncbi:ATP-binding protein [Solihabitans fulvus]|uniref:ATP-binding protein n=1 Tax=Solihabitans fulvus TaxID=1892852 RepID=A0A5B2X4F6_9PSEU|nr:AAA family ATPase [Solihabitans fulvus]KAA2258079.1 ATP-binding protein [Solihabitans fulvus]
MTTTADPPGVDDLLAGVARVWELVRDAVAARRAVDPDPDDPFRGLHLSHDAALRILRAPANGVARPRDEPPAEGSRLSLVAEAFGIDALDVAFLLVAMAPDLDTRFERLYGYLNDDVTQRRATVRLALDLHGLAATGPWRFRFAPDAPLVAGGLVEVRERDRPSLSRVLHVPDRVLAHLLGHDEPDRSLAELAARVADGRPYPAVSAALRVGVSPVYLRHDGPGWPEFGDDTFAALGRAALVVTTRVLAGHQEPLDALAELLREARLRRAGIVLGPVEELDPDRPERAGLLRAVGALADHVPLVVYGRRTWDPQWAHQVPLSVPAEPVDAAERAGQWRGALAGQGHRVPESAFAEVLTTYRLDSRQIRAAARLAGQHARAEGRPVRLDDLRAGALTHNGTGLERLARRIAPSVGWPDLVLPDQTRRTLADVVTRARHRDTVLGRWRMRPGGGRGLGVTALFAGESGTGKTMAAEVIAAELGMDLYVVDLSTVVDKYVGETEKNLERIFSEAVGVNGVLLFDEADAIFGKRSSVQDAQDRYANIESAYLLQRMESFDGIAVLTTNLRANLDDAFTRRLDVIADFPVPDRAQRLVLWDRCLGAALPRADDLDLGFCAERFELAGGSIRSCAVTAAYLAAAAGEAVTMADVIASVHQEYRKLGRLVRAEEFGASGGATAS